MIEVARQRIPLSMRTLATYALTDKYIKDNVEFSVIDLQIENVTQSEFLMDIALSSGTNLNKVIADEKPDAICISIWLWNYPFIKPMCDFIKKTYPDIPIVSGGQGLFYPEIYLKHNKHILMHCIAREGEEAFIDILYYFLGRLKISDIRGVLYRDAETGNLIETSKVERKVDLQRLKNIYINFPPKKLFHKGQPLYVVLEMYRGCIFKCPYCAWGTAIEENFFKDIDGLIEEINSFPEETSFEIADSFVNTPSHLKVLQGINKTFNYVSVNIEHRIYKKINEDLMETFNKFKQVYIDVGVQSFNQEVLKAIKRTNHMDVLQLWSDKSKENKHWVLSFHIILGLPKQTMEILKDDIARVSKLGTYMVFGVIALPDSEYWTTAVQWGGKFEDDYPFSFIESDYISKEDVEYVKETYGFIKEQGMESGSHLKQNLLIEDES